MKNYSISRLLANGGVRVQNLKELPDFIERAALYLAVQENPNLENNAVQNYEYRCYYRIR
jgi:hypothetical protein